MNRYKMSSGDVCYGEKSRRIVRGLGAGFLGTLSQSLIKDPKEVKEESMSVSEGRVF